MPLSKRKSLVKSGRNKPTSSGSQNIMIKQEDVKPNLKRQLNDCYDVVMEEGSGSKIIDEEIELADEKRDRVEQKIYALQQVLDNNFLLDKTAKCVRMLGLVSHILKILSQPPIIPQVGQMGVGMDPTAPPAFINPQACYGYPVPGEFLVCPPPSNCPATILEHGTDSESGDGEGGAKSKGSIK